MQIRCGIKRFFLYNTVSKRITFRNQVISVLNRPTSTNSDAPVRFFILVAGDIPDYLDRKVGALSICRKRLSQKMWPIYKHTRNRVSLLPGARCLIYIGGSGDLAQHVIAEAHIARVADNCVRSVSIDDSSLLVDTPASILHFSKVIEFNTPVNVKTLLGDLSFIPENRGKWGSALQGGCRRIEKSDYLVLKGVNL
jgi:hypothetical protein